ncbi:MAG: hypothetical protein LBL39_06610 [Planctomycetaceae bacterium]|jgi:hypothetical protein|nr:hypothetical protein [Planctomycetaceae bacterium]
MSLTKNVPYKKTKTKFFSSSINLCVLCAFVGYKLNFRNYYLLYFAMIRQKNIFIVLIFISVAVMFNVRLCGQEGNVGLQDSNVAKPEIANPSTHSNNANNDTDNSDTQYYLLKTSYIIDGKAKFDGKTYDIKTSYGSVRIPQQNVEFVGKSRLEIYKYRKTQINPSSTIELMQFAGWCAMNNFLTEAVAEYENALRIAEDNVTADIIRQRIATITGTNNPNKSANESADKNAANWEGTNSNNDQIKAAQNLTDNFRRHVQPILMKNCAIADCHSSAGGRVGNVAARKFMLVPATSGEFVNVSRENLNTCLLYVDLEYPMRSNLLNFIVVPHSRYTPPFNVESDEYNKITAWIQLAAKNIPLIKTSNLAHLFSNAQPALPSNPVVAGKYITAELNTTTQPANFDTYTTNTTTNLPASFKEVVNLQNQMNNKKPLPNNAAKNQFTPITTANEQLQTSVYSDNEVDNTDPMIFNRMYHPKVTR